MSGIVNGGRTAVQRKAVSHLREILFAQDAMRRAGWIDPDSDGVGSAPLLIELCGGGPLRGQKARSAPVLRCSSRTEGALGTTTDEGAFRFVVCLPKSGGGWTARDVDALDEERAEQEFVAYAWPAPESSFHRAFFIDAKERILTRTVPVRPSRPGELEQGERWEPSCDEAISPGDSSPWEVWRGKKPRKPTP